jgi:hypothetical protein
MPQNNNIINNFTYKKYFCQVGFDVPESLTGYT